MTTSFVFMLALTVKDARQKSISTEQILAESCC